MSLKQLSRFLSLFDSLIFSVFLMTVPSTLTDSSSVLKSVPAKVWRVR